MSQLVKEPEGKPSRESWKFADPKANPPWTGLYFTCEYCGGKFRLGCADECEPVTESTPSSVNLSLDRIRQETAGTGVDLWLAPPCWTCELRNVIATPRFALEGNPS